MRAETLKEAIKEAKRFLKAAKKVEIKTEKLASGRTYCSYESGKASGAAIRASMDLTRVLADLRQGR